MIFSMQVHYLETMCHVSLLPRFDLDLWPQGQISLFEGYIPVRPRTFLFFDLGKWYLVCRCITMRRCVTYQYCLSMTLTFDLRVKYPLLRGIFLSTLELSLSFNKGLWYLANRCITMRRCVMYQYCLSMTLTFDLRVKYPLLRGIFLSTLELFLSLNKGLWYLACRCITIRWCVRTRNASFWPWPFS